MLSWLKRGAKRRKLVSVFIEARVRECFAPCASKSNAFIAWETSRPAIPHEPVFPVAVTLATLFVAPRQAAPGHDAAPESRSGGPACVTAL